MPEEISKEEELKEAKEMQKDREAGMVIENIASKYGCSETTVRRRLDLWDEHVGKEAATKDKTESAATILQTVYGIMSTDKMAEKIGEITGADVATVEGIIKRIISGKATKAEVSKLFANVSGAISGYFSGKEVFSSMAKRLPTRDPALNEDEIKRMAEEAAAKKFKELILAADQKRKKQVAKAS
ncbi:hypothetical protein ES703_30705 [subsurface metagenome]|nr:hypothetical protein [bacterium]